jgi:hypothetical protein
VDLGPWLDPDGIPEADRLVWSDGRLFASLQRLRRGGVRWEAMPEGVVLELDPTALAAGSGDAVLAERPVGPNPKLSAGPRGLLVATGVTGSADGAVSRLDPDTGAAETLVTETDLGFDVWIALDTEAGLVVAGLPFEWSARPSFVQCEGGALELDGFVADAVDTPDGVWLAVRGDATGGRSGLVRIDPADCAELARVEDLRLPPYALAWVAPSLRSARR